MEAGKELLDRLLHFQTPSGNFPIYVHEYPFCRRKNQAWDILFPLFSIREEFFSVLGKELGERFTAAADSALQGILPLSEEADQVTLLQKAVLCFIYGDLLGRDNLREEGEKALSEPFPATVSVLGDPFSFSKVLLYFCYLEHRYPLTSFASYLSYASASRDAKSGKYVGFAFREDNRIFLADVYRALLFEESFDFSRPGYFCSEAVLLKVPEKKQEKTPFPGLLVKEEAYAIAAFDSAATIPNKGCYPLKITMTNTPGSLAVRKGSFFLTEISDPETIRCTFYKREDERFDISLFFDRMPGSAPTVRGNRATFFSVEDEVIISFPDLCFSLRGRQKGTHPIRWHLSCENRSSEGGKVSPFSDWRLYVVETDPEKENELELTVKILHKMK